MKTKFLLLFIVLPLLLFSQNSVSKKIYLDSLWIETQEGNHMYYRIIEDYNIQKPLHKVFDYYKNDTLQMKALTSSLDRIIREGPVVYYYQNGKKKTMVNYQGDRLVGMEYRWYENGNKKSVGEHTLSDDKLEPSNFTLKQFWDKNGEQKVIDGNGDYEENKDGFFATGKIANGRKIGEWRGEDKKSKISFVENFNDGNLIEGISKDSLNIEHHYNKIIVRPKPRKGLEHFYKYIGKKFRFTKETEAMSGKIYLSFIIEPDGNASDIKVLKSAGAAFDQEAIRLILQYPEWESGFYRGLKYRFSFNIPIDIRTPE